MRWPCSESQACGCAGTTGGLPSHFPIFPLVPACARARKAKGKEALKKVRIRRGWWEHGATSASAEVRGAGSQ